MKLNKTLWTLTFIIFSAMLASNAVTAFSGTGTGESNNPYLINTCLQLQEIEDEPNAHYNLNTNINCEGISFTPLSNFSGNLQGQNNAISNVQITGTNNLGLFSTLENGAVISNLKLLNFNITGDFVIGLLASESTGATISKVNATGIITATGGTVGGLIGTATTTYITNSSTDITISSNGSYIGGLVGEFYDSTIIYSQSKVDMTIYESDSVGGLVGFMNTNPLIEQSFATGTITGEYAGAGIIGDLSGGIVNNSYSTVNIITQQGWVAGIATCLQDAIIQNTYYAGIITDVSGDGFIGGISYDCYGGEMLGNVSDSYWDNDLTTPSGFGGGEPKTTTEMKTQSTYTNWDFTNTWHIASNQYPTLRVFTTIQPTEDEEEPQPQTGYVTAYGAQDVAPVVTDGLGKFFVGFGAFALIIGMLLALAGASWFYRKIK